MGSSTGKTLIYAAALALRLSASGRGLRGLPLGGYLGFIIPAGVLVGATELIRARPTLPPPASPR